MTEKAGSSTPLGPTDARQIGQEFRDKFRNAEVFEDAWNRLFELRGTVTLHLARRFLNEELVRYRARLAGLEELTSPAATQTTLPTPPEKTYVCPGCERSLAAWARTGHAESCPHLGCYQLEVQCRIAIERRRVAREKQRQLDRQALAVTDPAATAPAESPVAR